jgi:midasin
MECTWDAALLQRLHELPDELIEAIRLESSNEDYLSIFTRTSIDPRYTYTLFAHAPDLFAHICADIRRHTSLSNSIATLGRVVPFAPYLTPFAQELLSTEQHDFGSECDVSEHVSYLLGVLRLLNHEHRAFSHLVDPSIISSLLHRKERSIVYLAIRILQIVLNGADHWFEEMVSRYLGDDTPDNAIDGLWDGKSIDYRFLTLWEEERHERVQQLIREVQDAGQQNSDSPRVVPASCFHSSCTPIGGTLLPNFSTPTHSERQSQLVDTPTVASNVRHAANALKSSQPLLLTGLAGSGKTLLIRDLATRLGKLDKMVTLHLNEQSDAKLLVGVYTTGDTPGSFLWRPGVLTTAVQEGRWVCIEDLDRAPQEIIGALLPLIERGELSIPSRKQVIHAKQGFRILATARSSLNHRGEQTRPLGHMIGRRHWHEVHVAMPGSAEQSEIALHLYPSIKPFLPQFMTVFDRLQSMRQGAVLVGQSKTGVLRPISPRDLLKWCSRVTHLLQGRSSFTGSDLDDIFLEAVDCFVGALPDGEAKTSIAEVIAQELHIDPERRDYLLTQRDTRYEADKSRIIVGRYSLPRSSTAKKVSQVQSTFSTNPHTSRMLERVAAAVLNKEPLLLVGETGVGKTTAVQHLATHLDKKLVPFNLSQQSEAGDLLGGFKPVNARSLMVPLKDEFDDMFSASFSLTRNQQFLELLGKQMAKNNWKAVCKLWQQALKMVDQQRPSTETRQGEAPSKKRKVESKRKPDFAKWDVFAEKVNDMEHRLAAGNEGFAFSFVEGNIVKAARNGDWILLDEINLASSDTLEALADLLDPTSPSILLTEAGNIERIDASPDFRIFAAMNPATDVGKKDLPPGIRSRFTELYVDSPDKDIKSLQSIVRAYLRTEAAADPAIALDVSKLYQRIIELAHDNKLVDGAGQQPHFSLRTLTRTLSYARHIAPMCSLRRALYEGMQMSFMTFLDAESSKLVQPLLEKHLFAKLKSASSELRKALRKPADDRNYVQGYPGSKHWVCQGREELQDQPHYIITPFIRNNLENLVRASSTRQFPVLIQGPTSSGKTSMIEYLAGRTGHKFVRINNHEHTDLQEYLGTYVSGADGRLEFQEGVLVKALREGHWIVLDELNLAPTDVLEALNRLLDDNRELLIPETQEVVRPHADFMLFATQNPAGLYGGRKTLSRAFRNRFLELHFDDIPIDELQEILHKRTQLPESRCKRIVSVYRELSVLRQENRLFEQKSFATLRDLFRWALRTNDTIEQLAANGFMLLAERVRKPEERDAVKAVIEKVMSTKGPKVRIDEAALYSEQNPEIQQHVHHAKNQGAVWTNAMRRLYALVSRAVANDEPVLLVGETGCGKTTVFQMLADALSQELHIVNAHQNTETGDLIGSQRPVRNRAAIESQLRTQLLSSTLLTGYDMAAAQSTEALLDVYQQALKSLSPEEKQPYEASQPHVEIQNSSARFKALFEWADGSLVHAMKTGTFFLLDEISLADDSVLERINSVLEPSRSILLAEKGSLDSFVRAGESFQFFATMNPGGDYGKRELSPALRNRFTEIWVPALSDLDDVAQIVRGKLTSQLQGYSGAMVAFAHWFKEQYNTSASSAVSIRDVLAWSEFVNAFSSLHSVSGVVHGAAMVYIDTLGANPAGLMTMTGKDLDAERRACLTELSRLLQNDAAAVYDAEITVTADAQQATFGPFTVTRKPTAPEITNTFSFDAPTTRANAMRVVRAMQLVKPVMLEGSPGVGKTALVTAISAVAGVPLTRINLSEQTDLMDLFGSDTPVQGAEAGTFAWRDAPFLRAMKSGEWVLLDEMNLASQSVLEGLNACLDHRGEVFIPEIGQTFARHPEFRLFAAQNPHHQGGGRKGLPASFVNRFTVVYADSFNSQDLIMICQRLFPTLEDRTIEQAVQFVDTLETDIVHHRRFGAQGGPWEFNLRDTTRWLSLVQGAGLLSAGSAQDFVNLLFTQRFRSASDRAHVARVFSTVYGGQMPTADMFSSVSKSTLQLGLGIMSRDPVVAPAPKKNGSTFVVSHHLQALQSLMVAVQCSWPVILSGSSGSGKTALIESLAGAVGSSVQTFAMNAETDAMDLVGGYEQADPYRQTLQMLDEFCTHLENVSKSAMVGSQNDGNIALAAELRRCKANAAVDIASLATVARLLKENPSLPGAEELSSALEQSAMPMDKARFVWIDGILVDALQEGKWLVLDNANLCSPSVLDRLNSLLEPNGSLIINEHVAEDGTPRTIRPHPNFRIFMTVDSRYGELSRPMRNRALEIHLLESEDRRPDLKPLHPESAVARFRQCKAIGALSVEAAGPEPPMALLQDHLGIGDHQLAPRFVAQLTSGLYRGFSTDTEAESDNAPRFGKAREQLAAFYKLAVGEKQVSADFACVQVSTVSISSK